jgi:hypothetical protein
MMRAITLIQPWAGPIAQGIKTVENRTWEPPLALLGQRIAIHAGAKLDRETVEDLYEDGLDPVRLWEMRSAALAVATLERFVADRFTSGLQSPLSLTREQARFYNGPVGFVLSDIVAIDPVPCKGALGFWTLPDEIERSVRIREQIARSAA